MEERRIPSDYESIEAHIRRARIERSVAMAQVFANGSDALGRGIGRVVAAVIGSFSNARDAHTIEAEALTRRTILR